MKATVKIVLCGDGAVGKTSLKARYLGDVFTKNYKATVGADFAMKQWTFQMDSESYLFKFSIWDLSGQTHFSRVRAGYYKGAHAILLLYDITQRRTFNNIKNWMNEIQKHLQITSLLITLLGNKLDLRNESDNSISRNEGEQLAHDLSTQYQLTESPITYFETSALTGENVKLAFETFAKRFIKRELKK
ncbi:MAG: Rab family GTPase [Candidatus Hodarchaeales archaeon]|jgi:Ras-related protein Rab-1A